MPIKDKSIYPANWREFSLSIRKGRASGRCEECGVNNGWWKVVFDVLGEQFTEYYATATSSTHFHGEVISQSRIVLTVAHLNAAGDICRCQDETGKLCANPDHVKAMCQACHNAYDAPMRRRNATVTIGKKNDAARPLLQGEIQ